MLFKWAFRILYCICHERHIALNMSVPSLEHSPVAVTEKLANDIRVGASRQLPVRVIVAKRVRAQFWHFEFDF